MTPGNSIVPVSARIPVSIIERLFASLAFVVSALSGAIGAMMMQQFLARLRTNETAGLQAFYTGAARINVVVGSVLTIAVFLCGVALLVCLIRMFTNNVKASPPGLLLFVIGGFSLVPALLTGISVYLLMESVVGPQMAGVSSVATSISALTVASIALTCLLILILGAFSFISFSAKSGRKYSPFLLLLVLEIGTISAAVAFFRLLQICLTQTSTLFW